MNLPKHVAAIAWGFDVMLMPSLGLMFVLASIGMTALCVTFGDQLESCNEALAFAAMILGTGALGLACIAFGLARYPTSPHQH